MNIRSGLMKDVYETLDSHSLLDGHDFQIVEQEYRGNTAGLLVSYRHNSSFTFEFSVPQERTSVRGFEDTVYQYPCRVQPGYESTEEKLTAVGRERLVAELRSWQDRVYEDLVSAPVLKQFQCYAAHLDEIEKRLQTVPDEPASEDEIAELRDALDRMKDEMSQQLAKQNLDQKELEERIESLQNDIRLLKESLPATTKRQWGVMLYTRLRKWRDKFSVRQIGTGARVLSKALPQGVSEELDLIREVADSAANAMDELGQQS
jgi:hypothetical protein